MEQGLVTRTISYFLSVVLILVLSATVGLADDTKTVPSDETPSDKIPSDRAEFHLFILAGQSNMAGRGTVTEADRTPIDRVLALNNKGEWQPAIDPLHWDKPTIVGVGLGRSFAAEYAKTHPEVTIGLIPCAVGGSPIDSWQPDGFHRQTNTHPWDDAIKRIRPALAVGTLKGILWHQGESDANPKFAESYEKKLHDLVFRFRHELASPTLPLIAGQMGQFSDRPWNDEMRTIDAAHRALPEAVPQTAFVPADDLKHRGDGVHFSADSYREFGQRYFAAFEKLSRDDQSN